MPKIYTLQDFSSYGGNFVGSFTQGEILLAILNTLKEIKELLKCSKLK